MLTHSSTLQIKDRSGAERPKPQRAECHMDLCSRGLSPETTWFLAELISKMLQAFDLTTLSCLILSDYASLFSPKAFLLDFMSPQRTASTEREMGVSLELLSHTKTAQASLSQRRGGSRALCMVYKCSHEAKCTNPQHLG